VLEGVVQMFDPLLATISVAVKRQAADSASGASSKVSSGSSALGQPGSDSATNLLHQLGLTSDQVSSEFTLEQITPISPSPPPALSVLGSIADVLSQSIRLLSIDTAATGIKESHVRGMESDERKETLVGAESASVVAVRQDLLGLLVAQLQQQLLLVLHLHLQTWLKSTPVLCREVLQMLSVSLQRWESSSVSSELTLYPQEWATRARLLSQRLVEHAWHVQDPFFTRRLPLQPSKPVAPTAAASSASASASTVAPAASDDRLPAASRPRLSSQDNGNGAVRVNSGPLAALARSSFSLLPDASESVSEDEELESPAHISVALSSAAPPPKPSLLDSLDRLASMGFSPVACRFALASTRGNLEASIGVILEQAMDEGAEVDEGNANAAFEATIDRLGQRAAADSYRTWQEAQQEEQLARQASAVVDASAPAAPPLSVPASSSYAAPRLSALKPFSSDSDRRVALAAPHVHMTSRYAWNEETPLDALALSAPLDPSVATSRALNSGASARPTDWSAEQDRALLLSRARDGTLIGAELVIPPDAVESLSHASGPSQKPSYKIGDNLTIIDLVNKVCPAVVDDMNEDGSKIYLHYIGWSKKWDEVRLCCCMI
jgi:hypothetical protein